ncbi:MAG: hemolysin family protein [Gammaproteobacteria bacterium]|nr:hemolysin family protein [Gammaproteobacteria bacterium]
MELIVFLLIMLFLLFLKGFFSGSEIALVNSDKLKLHHKANQGSKGAQLVLKLFETPDVLLGTTLVGTNIFTIALTTLGTMFLIRYFGASGEFYALLIYTPLFLILGEIVPKSIYQQKSDVLAPIVVYPLRFFSWLFYPLVFVFSRIARLGARIVGGGKTEQNVFITREQIRSLVEMAERGSNVDAFDRGRIKRVIRFAETTVGEAMIPVAEITAIGEKQNTRDAIDLVRRRGYNRLPVSRKNISDIVGIVTLTTWDLMDRELPGKDLSEFIQPALYASAYQTIDELLPILRQRKDHMAIVVDEFGSAVGMITMEDILEEVVGEIDVGYDFEEYLPRRKRIFEMLDEEVYLMDARLPISEANEVLFTQLPATENHTLGGLVVARLRRIPVEGDSITEEGYRFTVEEATERSIVRLRVERM